MTSKLSAAGKLTYIHVHNTDIHINYPYKLKLVEVISGWRIN